MDIVESLVHVVRAVRFVTHNDGSAQVRERVEEFLATPRGSSQTFNFVGGITFSNFYASSNEAFDATKDELWTQIVSGTNVTDLAMPAWMHEDTGLGEVAGFINFESEARSGG